MEDKLIDLGTRLREYIGWKRLGTNELGRMIGSSGALVSNILNGKNFGMNKFLAIGKACPDLNLCWLLTGEGKMLLDGKVELTENDLLDQKQQVSNRLENRFLLEKLELKISSLERVVAYQEMTIEAYKNASDAAQASNKNLRKLLDDHIKTINHLTADRRTA